MTTLRQRLEDLGFDAVGFSKIEGPAPGAHALDRWLAEGMQGGMDWIARNADRRKDPRLVIPGANLMIALGVSYATDASPAPGARVARYALYEDYHDTIKPALVEAGRVLEREAGLGPGDYRYYVDTGPVLERDWAALSGLGFQGKNAMLISREHGNWLFLSAIVAKVPEPVLAALVADIAPGPPRRLCGTCTRCLDACPTRALSTPGVVDARRCLSYLTIENKGPIPEEFRALVGDRLYGCDICSEVCPWNRFAARSRSLLLKPKPEIAALRLPEILALTQERFAEVYRRTPVKRIKLAGLLRNACVVAGNSGDPSLIPALRTLLAHDSDLVREHARWALARLGDTPPAGS